MRRGREKEREKKSEGEKSGWKGTDRGTAECGETSAGKSQLRGMSVSTVEGQHGNERIERGRRVERVESGTRQTCLAITQKLKRSRQPLCFLVAADSFGTTRRNDCSIVSRFARSRNAFIRRVCSKKFSSLSPQRYLMRFTDSVEEKKKKTYLLAYFSSTSSIRNAKSVRLR